MGTLVVQPPAGLDATVPVATKTLGKVRTVMYALNPESPSYWGNSLRNGTPELSVGTT